MNGKNILELFPNIQFYDYTKVFKRTELTKKYANYDLTYSYSGDNLVTSIEALRTGTRVAVVFEELPTVFWGREVIDGDLYDMRYIDEPSVIVGLKYKNVRNKLDLEKSSFVISKKRYEEMAVEIDS
jgi:hypothetical protein